MADLETKFKAIADKIAANADATKNLSNDKKLEIYALFKQGTVGDVNIDKPGMLDQKGRAKWDAWSGKKGTPKEEAQEAYIDLVESILG